MVEKYTYILKSNMMEHKDSECMSSLEEKEVVVIKQNEVEIVVMMYEEYIIIMSMPVCKRGCIVLDVMTCDSIDTRQIFRDEVVSEILRDSVGWYAHVWFDKDNLIKLDGYDIDCDEKDEIQQKCYDVYKAISNKDYVAL